MKELSPPVCRRADRGSFPRMEAPSPSIRLSALGKTRGRTDEGAGGGCGKSGVVGVLMGWSEGFFQQKGNHERRGVCRFQIPLPIRFHLLFPPMTLVVSDGADDSDHLNPERLPPLRQSSCAGAAPSIQLSTRTNGPR